MTSVVRRRSAACWRSLPNEHGFWVMLGASILSSELRAGFATAALVTGAAAFFVVVLVATVFHRKIRGRESAQLAATAGLAFAGTPIEWIAGLPLGSVLAGTAARLAIFLSSALLVRAAFARSARNPAMSCASLQQVAVVLVAAAGLLLALAGWYAEARACAAAGALLLALACSRPTVKQLKPLGLALAGVTLGSAVVLAL